MRNNNYLNHYNSCLFNLKLLCYCLICVILKIVFKEKISLSIIWCTVNQSFLRVNPSSVHTSVKSWCQSMTIFSFRLKASCNKYVCKIISPEVTIKFINYSLIHQHPVNNLLKIVAIFPDHWFGKYYANSWKNCAC